MARRGARAQAPRDLVREAGSRTGPGRRDLPRDPWPDRSWLPSCLPEIDWQLAGRRAAGPRLTHITRTSMNKEQEGEVSRALRAAAALRTSTSRSSCGNQPEVSEPLMSGCARNARKQPKTSGCTATCGRQPPRFATRPPRFSAPSLSRGANDASGRLRSWQSPSAAALPPALSEDRALVQSPRGRGCSRVTNASTMGVRPPVRASAARYAEIGSGAR